MNSRSLCPQTAVKLIIADDHPVVRNGVKAILDGVDFIRLVGEAGSGTELLDLCRRLNPDVVLTDVVMHGEMDGEAVTRRICDEMPLINVVVMSMYERFYDIMRMINAGAVGYISKNAEKEEYIEAIRSAGNSRVFYCKRIRNRLQSAGPNRRRWHQKIDLNEREIQVLQMLCMGHSNAEIAAGLQLSHRTVEGYRFKLLEKFGTNNILKVIFCAISTGLVNIEEPE
jgi:two-component system, NarL family, response regulator NreC